MIESDIIEGDEFSFKALEGSIDPGSNSNDSDTSLRRATPKIANTATEVDQTQRMEKQRSLLATAQQPNRSAEANVQTSIQTSPPTSTYDVVPTSPQTSLVSLVSVGPQDVPSAPIPIPLRADRRNSSISTAPVTFLTFPHDSLSAMGQGVLPVEMHQLINAISETISTKMISTLVNAASTLSQTITPVPSSTDDLNSNKEYVKNREETLDKVVLDALRGSELYTLGMRNIIKVDISHFSEKGSSKVNTTPIPARLIQNLQGGLIREPTSSFINLFESTVISTTEKGIKAAGLAVERIWDRAKRLHIKRHEEQKAYVAQGACFFRIAEEDYEWAVSEGKVRDMGGGEGSSVTFEWKCKLCYERHAVQVFR